MGISFRTIEPPKGSRPDPFSSVDERITAVAEYPNNLTGKVELSLDRGHVRAVVKSGAVKIGETFYQCGTPPPIIEIGAIMNLGYYGSYELTITPLK